MDARLYTDTYLYHTGAKYESVQRKRKSIGIRLLVLVKDVCAAEYFEYHMLT